MSAQPMRRNRAGDYETDDFPDFRPNVSPRDMFQAGIFGGTYFRDITIANKAYKGAWKEFAATGMFTGLDVKTQVASARFDATRNRYGVSCGQSLDVWVEKGWIVPEFDTHGWVHWYCRFFSGRRCADDARQVSRWLRCAGPKGRWRRNLIAKCVKAGRAFDDETVSPVVRQTLLHWGYELTRPHYDAYRKLLEAGHRTSFIPQTDMRHVVKRKSASTDDDEQPEPERAEQPRTRRRRKAAG